MRHSRKILYHVTIYGTGQLLRGLSSLLLLPVYTRFLSPADYGLVELVSAIVDLTSLVLGLRIGAAIFKHYTDATELQHKHRVISTAASLLVFAGAVGAISLVICAGAVTAALGAPAGFAPALRLLALTLVFSAVNETFFAYLRIEDRSLLYVAFNLARFLGQFALGVVFVAGWGLGYQGVIWAALISSGAVAVVFSVWLWRSVGFRIDFALARRLARFSLPIMIVSLCMYYIAFGNRYLLKLHVGLEAVGIYAIAYKFGLTFFNVFWTPFATYWAAKQYEYLRRADAGRYFGNVFLAANLVLLPAAAAVIVATPHFLRLVVGEAFWPAIEVVPWVVGASVMLCWADFFRIGLLQASRTGQLAWNALCTSVLITVLYHHWIPSEGAVGAAKATFVAYAFYLSYTFLIGQRLFVIDVPWWRLVVMTAYFSGVCWILFSWRLADVPGLFFKPMILLIAGLMLLFTSLLPGPRAAVAAMLAGWRVESLGKER